MKYVLYAILIYIVYLLVRSFLAKQKRKAAGSNNEPQKKRNYNLNDIQDAEFREVNKDQ